MKTISKYILRFLIILLFQISLLIADDIGRIYSVDYPNGTKINLGPVYVGDAINSRFVVENLSDQTYQIYEVKPTYGIFRSPIELIADEFLSYRTLNTNFPIYVSGKSKINIEVQYKADSNLTVYPLGWYNADLLIGMSAEPDTNVVLDKKFNLLTKKSKLYIDGYDDRIIFDSTYINPPIPQVKDWKFKSIFQDSLQVTNQNFTLSTAKIADNEFFPEFFEINPLFLKKYDALNLRIGYKPRNIGIDSGRIEMHYLKNGNDEFAAVNIIGIGVQQKLQLINSNYNFYSDTLFLGNIPANKDVLISLDILNASNFAINNISEKLINQNPDYVKVDFEIISKMQKSTKYIDSGLTESVELRVNVQDRGNFELKYVIESDIENRFLFVPQNAKYKIITIIGRAVEPKIQVSNDIVDFEKVYLYLPYCQSRKDTSIRIRNIGNDTLRINKVELVLQKPQPAFACLNNELTINPNESAEIQLTFEPTSPQFYSTDLILHNNSSTPNYTLSLVGTSITPAVAKLSIDTFRIRPGSVLLIPIKTDSNIVFANNFSDTLYYNRSILHYVGYEVENTASRQPLDFLNITESLDGKLAINIRKPNKTNFLLNENLIILKFNTFLGNSPSTSISFSNPQLGNEYCEKSLNLIKDNIINGTVILDSICGIDLKAYPILVQSINYKNDKIEFHYEILSKTNLSYQIYDAIGNLIYSKNEVEYEPNSYSDIINIDYLSKSIYFIVLKVNNNYSTIKFINLN